MTQPLLRIRRGTLVMLESDWNGGPAAPAIQIVADNGPVVLDLKSSDLGSDLTATDDSIVTAITAGSPILQISKKNASSPGRVTGTVTNMRFSPYAELDGGNSIRLGSSCIAGVTISGSTFSHGVGGTPAVVYFEDYPTVLGLGGPAGKRHAGGINTVKSHSRIVMAAGAGGRRQTGIPNVYQQQFITFAAGISPRVQLGTPRVIRVPYLIQMGTGAHGRRQAGGMRVVLDDYLIHPTAIPQRVRIGQPTVRLSGQIYPAAVPQRVRVGSPTVHVGTVVVHPTAVPQRAVFGVPRIDQTVFPAAVPQRVRIGTPTVKPGTVTIRPVAVPQRRIVGSPHVIVGDARILPTPVPQRAVFGNVYVFQGLGDSEAYGPVVGF